MRPTRIAWQPIRQWMPAIPAPVRGCSVLPERTGPPSSAAPSLRSGSWHKHHPLGCGWGTLCLPRGGGSWDSGAQRKPHLSSWHGGEAQTPVGDEGVLHRVHRETVEGGLGAHVVLEAFDHSTIEPAPNRGPSAGRPAVAPCPAACWHFHARVLPHLSPPHLSPRLCRDHALCCARTSTCSPAPTPLQPQGTPCELGTLAPAAPFSWVPLAGLSRGLHPRPSAHHDR